MPDESKHGDQIADGTHVSREEAEAGRDIAGTPIYEVEPAESSWLPTKKWIAALSGAIASILASWIVTGQFDDVERGMAGAAIVSLAAAYWKSNDPTAGGVPER